MDLTLVEERLIDRPLSFLSTYKLSCIISILKKAKIENFLEIGTWIGGTTYVLSNRFPDIHFDTVDINDFLRMYKENRRLIKVLESELSQKIDFKDLRQLQYFYRNHSKNVNFIDADQFVWKDNFYDAILVDGDHNTLALRNDLRNAFNHIRNTGLIFVDDTSYPHIRAEVENFCKENWLRVKFKSSDPLEDLAIIRVKKDRKNFRPKFPKSIKKLRRV
jgi:predicted O-methyltransferase YrrM